MNSSMELDHYEKQLIKYTKNHYKVWSFDNFNDLKLIAAKHYNLKFDQVNENIMYNMVISLYQKLCDYGYLHFKLDIFLENIFKRAKTYYKRNHININDITRHILIEFQNMQVKMHETLPDLDLGENDQNLLQQLSI